MPGDHLLSGLTPAELIAVRVSCEQSQYYFTRLMFRAMEHQKFLDNQLAELTCGVIDQVFEGKITRLIANEPPGHGKTLRFVHMLCARGFALNPRSRFLHASYSQSLVLFNSAQVRRIMALPEYQAMWPRMLRADSRAKGLWMTPEGGMFKASPSAGEVTGFRAGTLDDIPEEGWDSEEWFEEFAEPIGGADPHLAAGSLIIDDAVKPGDAKSDEKRGAVNARYMNTFRSRLAHERVPIIITMQRIHHDDLAGFLLAGGGGEKFHHLMLPVVIERPPPLTLPRGSTIDWKVTPSEELGRKGTRWPLTPYPSEYTHGIRIDHDLPPGMLWATKINDVRPLKRDMAVFAAQYMQDPRAGGLGDFTPKMFHAYEIRPRTLRVAIMGDPSGGGSRGNRQNSDRTALVVVGIDAQRKKYLLDGFCHRMTLGERWLNLKRLYQRWKRMEGIVSVSVGYERFGMQTDQQYFQERQEVEDCRFPIEELMWARQGSSSKNDRIGRLQPDFRNANFYMPATIFRPEYLNAKGLRADDATVYWEGGERTVMFEPAFHETAAMREMRRIGEHYRIAETLTAKDENGQVYDLTWMLMEELRSFPNAAHDDLSDAVSRIYDMNIMPPDPKETRMADAINEANVE